MNYAIFIYHFRETSRSIDLSSWFWSISLPDFLNRWPTETSRSGLQRSVKPDEKAECQEHDSTELAEVKAPDLSACDHDAAPLNASAVRKGFLTALLIVIMLRTGFPPSRLLKNLIGHGTPCPRWTRLREKRPAS